MLSTKLNSKLINTYRGHKINLLAETKSIPILNLSKSIIQLINTHNPFKKNHLPQKIIYKTLDVNPIVLMRFYILYRQIFQAIYQ